DYEHDISVYFFFSSRRRHTRLVSDWSSDVCSSDLVWLDPQKLAALEMTPLDVANAIRHQNLDAPAGRLGQPPTSPSQAFQLPIKIGRASCRGRGETAVGGGLCITESVDARGRAISS